MKENGTLSSENTTERGKNGRAHTAATGIRHRSKHGLPFPIQPSENTNRLIDHFPLNGALKLSSQSKSLAKKIQDPHKNILVESANLTNKFRLSNENFDINKISKNIQKPKLSEVMISQNRQKEIEEG
jgi:hypothetical protein